MSDGDQALRALLADYGPPAVPAGLAARVTAAAVARPQDPAAPAGRPPRDRRGGWMRRPFIAGAAAMGLLVSSAVAATLAGVEIALPPKVQSLLAEVPIVGRKLKMEAPPRRPAERRAAVQAPAPAPEATAGVTDAEVEAMIRAQSERRARRQAAARQIVEQRRAAGLPTPRADRIEQRAARRPAWLDSLPPEEREHVLARAAEARRDRVRARLEAREALQKDAAESLTPEQWRALGPAERRRAIRQAVRRRIQERREALGEDAPANEALSEPSR